MPNMMFNVPQFIDVEDKIAGPLTWKQLLWMIGMGATLLIMYGLFETGAFFALAIPVVLIFVAFAFYKPHGFPMTTFVFNAVVFLFRPKVAVWERPLPRRVAAKEPSNQETKVVPAEPKVLTEERLKEIAKMVDHA